MINDGLCFLQMNVTENVTASFFVLVMPQHILNDLVQEVRIVNAAFWVLFFLEIQLNDLRKPRNNRGCFLVR